MSLFSNCENEIFNCDVSFKTNATDDEVKDFENNVAGSRCGKKEFHPKFIPFNKISLKHFDYPYKRKELTALTKALGNLVVKLEVNKTSSDRPSVIRKKGKICGTGRITFCNVRKRRGFRHCMCKVCKISTSPEAQWGEISVVTAAHVVFNKLEAENSSCILRYNKKDSANTVALEGLGVFKVNVEHDRSHVVYVTHDMKLVRLLIRSIYLFRSKHRELHKEFKSLPNNNLAILVSHPHGWHKHVSIGTYERKELDHETAETKDRVLTRYTHRAQSCPGSSGAPVYFLGKDDVWTMHPHSGFKDGLGVSSTEYERI